MPDLIPTDELAAALRRHADGSRAHEAAVELLIAHGRWLRAPEFQRHVTVAGTPGGAYASPDWEELDRLAGAELAPATGSEFAILAVAVSLANGALANVAHRCDEQNRRYVEDAVDQALWGTR